MATSSVTYNHLSFELKVRIAQLAFGQVVVLPEELRRTSRFSWPRYACLDAAWRETVESDLWETLKLEVSDLIIFRKAWIGRRRRFLKTIEFRINVTDWFPAQLRMGQPWNKQSRDQDGAQDDEQPDEQHDVTAEPEQSPTPAPHGENEEDINAITPNPRLVHRHTSLESRVWTAFSKLFGVLAEYEAQNDDKNVSLVFRYDVYNLNDDSGRYEIVFPVGCPALPVVHVIHSMQSSRRCPSYLLSPSSIVAIASSLPELVHAEFDFDPDRLSAILVMRLDCKAPPSTQPANTIRRLI